MQRPRRTSEFYEELPSSGKRQSRQRSTAAPSPAPGTAKKYGTRQSRIAVSVDRATVGNPYLNIPPSSAQRGSYRSVSASGAPTPQRTPRGKSPAHGSTHVVYTAEKQRPGGAGCTLHNDKRWVQDQVARITEYLRSEVAKGAIPSITPDFFNARSGGLRQMSIKQFIALVNYFLHLIFGNRFNVGANYVEDIVNILHKLQYPHQLNKSWLKTPNTQHSFGNVVLLFDFFMDFVQPRDLEPGDDFTLPFAVVEEEEVTVTLTQPNAQNQRIPDVEFQAQLVRDTEEAFLLWDKGLDADPIQTQTCDALVQKRCNIANLATLFESNIQLKQQLAELEQQQPQIRKQDEEQCSKLSEELKYTMQQIEMISDDLQLESKKLKQLKAMLAKAREEEGSLSSEVQELNAEISRQQFNVEQRDALMGEVMQLKQILKSQERAVRDLIDCSHHQQVLLSRTKNQVREQVHKFNTQIHEIVYLQLHSISSTEDLQLPLNAKQEDLQRILPTLQSLRHKTEAKLKKNAEALELLESELLQLSSEIESSLKSKLNVFNSKLFASRKNMQSYEEQQSKERSTLETRELELEQHYELAKTGLEGAQTECAEMQQKLVDLVRENEETMSSTEEKYHECARRRAAFLDAYESTLDQANAQLHTLAEMVDANQLIIDKQKEKFGDVESNDD